MFVLFIVFAQKPIASECLANIMLNIRIVEDECGNDKAQTVFYNQT